MEKFGIGQPAPRIEDERLLRGEAHFGDDRSLAVEWGGRGIRLNAIAPGPFPTEGAWERLVPKPELAAMFEAKNPLKRAGRHEELANLAAFLMADEVGYINGEVVTIDGGEWLQGAGQFNFVGQHMTDADWQSLRAKK